ncbi:oligosaccharide flippase family protein [Mesobacillus foraminis]|uniref:oligosaccharide flippase family protein n=1 Tax=Mesobacillus foraminis TaxID=279826 RepID=UPI0039A2A5F7
MIKKIHSFRNNELLFGSFVNFSIKGIAFLINYLIMIFSIKFFGVEFYGEYNINLSLIDIFSVFCLFGADIYFLKELSKSKNDYIENKYLLKNLMLICCVFILLLTIVFLTAMNFPFIRDYFNLNSINVYLLILGIAFATLNLLFLSGIRASGSIITYSIGEKFIQRFITLIIVFLFIIINVRLEPAILIFFSTGTATIYSLIFLNKFVFHKGNKMKFTKIKPGKYAIPNLLKEMKFIFISSFILILLGKMDTLTISFFMNSSEVGKYNVALQIAVLINFSMGSINSILSPLISRQYHSNQTRLLEKNIKMANNIILATSFALTLIIITFYNFIISIIGLNENIFIPLVILLIGQLFSAFMGSVVNLMNMTGNFKIVSFSMVCALLTNLTLNFILVPSIGLTGAAISTAISYFIKDFICTLYGLKMFNFKFSHISYLVLWLNKGRG